MFVQYRKIVSIVLFVFLIVNSLICIFYDVPFRNSGILLLLIIILFLLSTNKISWFGLFIICLYGIYDEIYYGRFSSVPLNMNFVYPAQELMRDQLKYNILKWFLGVIPILFYLQLLVLLVMRSSRRIYGIKAGK